MSHYRDIVSPLLSESVFLVARIQPTDKSFFDRIHYFIGDKKTIIRVSTGLSCIFDGESLDSSISVIDDIEIAMSIE
jgi:hypothetical protein